MGCTEQKQEEEEEKKGYLKIHVAVNIKTKEILALEVTDEKVHDGREMKALVERVLERNKNNNKNYKNYKIKTVLADGAYDSNKNFKYLQKKKDSTRHQSKKEFYHIHHYQKTIRQEIGRLKVKQEIS